MSQENVEMIRSAVEAWSRGDWDNALKDADPDFVLDNSMNLGEWRGVHRGPEEVKRAWRIFTDAWESVSMEVSEFIDVGEDVVVTRQKVSFIGRDGIELPGPVRSGWVWRIRDGKLVYVATYNDLDEALEAAGLQE
jgi:ketosteroid isomerase-like protein